VTLLLCAAIFIEWDKRDAMATATAAAAGPQSRARKKKNREEIDQSR